jgi:hypothetical protein
MVESTEMVLKDGEHVLAWRMEDEPAHACVNNTSRHDTELGPRGPSDTPTVTDPGHSAARSFVGPASVHPSTSRTDRFGGHRRCIHTTQRLTNLTDRLDQPSTTPSCECLTCIPTLSIKDALFTTLSPHAPSSGSTTRRIRTIIEPCYFPPIYHLGILDVAIPLLLLRGSSQ